MNELEYSSSLEKMSDRKLFNESERHVVMSFLNSHAPKHPSHRKFHLLRDECVRRMNWNLFFSAYKKGKRTVREVEQFFPHGE